MITITSSTYLGTILDNNRHQEKPTDAKRHQQMVPGTPKGCSRMRGGSCWHWMAFAGVWWCLTAAFSVLWCLEMWEGLSGVSQRVSELLLWTCLRFGFLPGSIWVFRPCLVQQLLYIGKSSKGKIPCTWHFWNIKIPKPPYIKSLKIIGFLHFCWIAWSVRRDLQGHHQLSGKAIKTNCFNQTK